MLDLSYMLKTLDIGQLNYQDSSVHNNDTSMQVAVGAEYLDSSVEQLQESREFSTITSEQRVLGSRVSCHRVRGRLDGSYLSLPKVKLSYKDGSIPGNGLGAYNSSGIE